MRCLVPFWSAVLVGCTTPGTLYSPEGADTLRTALYRVGVNNGPELVIVLSNGELTCGIPAYPDSARQAEALEGLLVAACREGARHVALHAYTAGPWAGDFPGMTGSVASSVSPTQPRLSRGAFYAVEEAFLIEIDGLERGYAASEDLYLPNLGDGGNLELSPVGTDAAEGAGGTDRLRGWFDFPLEGVSGNFVAERCTGDTSLIDVVAAETDYYCQ